MKLTILAGAALMLGFAVQPASAMPAASGNGVVAGTALETIQYRRMERPRGRMCRVETVRRRTPRGVVITKVKRCR